MWMKCSCWLLGDLNFIVSYPESLCAQALHRRRAQAASHLKQPMLAEIYGSQPLWTPLRLFRAALIALVGGIVAGTHAAPASHEPAYIALIYAISSRRPNLTTVKGDELAPTPYLSTSS